MLFLCAGHTLPVARHGDNLDLDRLGLKPGGGVREESLVSLQAYSFSGQSYEPADSPVPVLVDVSRTTTGYVVRVRFAAVVKGPCMRCNDDQGFAVAIDQTDVHEPQLELASDYVDDDIFNLAAFVHDTIGLALPQTMSGDLGAGGGCELCGRSPEQLKQLGIDQEGEGEGGDPRWAKLRELEL